jgi:hypothetical protein
MTWTLSTKISSNAERARTQDPCAGRLHPLLKVRKEFREIFLEMGFEEMPTSRSSHPPQKPTPTQHAYTKDSSAMVLFPCLLSTGVILPVLYMFRIKISTTCTSTVGFVLHTQRTDLY